MNALLHFVMEQTLARLSNNRLFLFAGNLFKLSVIISAQKCGIAPLNGNFSRFDFLMPETHRLVGGLETNPHAWPWTGQLVAIKNEKQNIIENSIINFGGINNINTTMIAHKCGCSLIDREFVVTAAHCFAKSRLTTRYRVLLGGHEIYSGKLYRVVSISIHPLYQIVHSAYDIALLRIAPEVEFTDTMWPICLPTLPVKINGMCVVTGWGRIKEDGEKAPNLREIHVPIIATFICNDINHYAGRLHPPSMICAGFNGGKIDSCQGDSGGPLQCQNIQGQWELQGVVSWGVGCAKPKLPGVYTKMFVMTPWIRVEINRLRFLDRLGK